MKWRPPPMEKPYVMLEKKLDQLESNIRELYSQVAGEDPVDGPSSGRRSVGVEDVRKQIAFLGTLLAAEKECHSQSTPRHLRHISERFDGLQGAFQDWEDSPIPPEAFLGDGLSTCSCNHECFIEPEAEDDEDALESEPEPEPELIVPEEDLTPEGVQEEDEEEETPPQCRRSGGRCGYISVAIAVVTVVMGLMANFKWLEEEVYFVPT